MEKNLGFTQKNPPDLEIKKQDLTGSGEGPADARCGTIAGLSVVRPTSVGWSERNKGRLSNIKQNLH